MSKIVYLQKEHAGLPAGTPLERAEMTSAHHQARAMVGTALPSGYYRLAGTTGPATLMIPLFKGLVEETHPNDPSKTGPYVCVGFETLAPDRLPVKYLAVIAVNRNYPTSKVGVVLNDLPGGNVVKVCRPSCTHINLEEVIEEALQFLKSNNKDMDLEVVYSDSW